MEDPRIESESDVEAALEQIRDQSATLGAESPAEDFDVELTTDDMAD